MIDYHILSVIVVNEDNTLFCILSVMDIMDQILNKNEDAKQIKLFQLRGIFFHVRYRSNYADTPSIDTAWAVKKVQFTVDSPNTL